jgi:hypothetical protein
MPAALVAALVVVLLVFGWAARRRARRHPPPLTLDEPTVAEHLRPLAAVHVLGRNGDTRQE